MNAPRPARLPMRPVRRWRAPDPGRDLLWLLLFALVLLASGLGLRDPWPADEPRFAMIARDIVESGRWFLPQRGPELYAEKPPVFIWAQALALRAVGDLRLAFLLPSLLAALGTLWLTFDLARRLWNRQSAFWATLALLVTVQFTLQARSAQIDALLLLWTTLGLYGLLRHLLLGPHWGWYLIGGFATGLGVITKGTGFLPWLVLLPYAWARWRDWPGLPRLAGGWRWALGPLAMLLAIGLWLVPLLLLSRDDPAIAAYRDELLFRQTVTRYANAWHHHQPPWYFLTQVIPLLWLPLVALLPWSVPAWRRRLRRGDVRQWLLLGWIVLVVAFFSASPGKREMYILPALPAFALAFAPLLPGLLRRPGVHRLLFGLATLLAAVLLLGAGWAWFGRPTFAIRIETQNMVAPWPWLFGVGLVGLLAILLAGPRRGAAGFAALLACLWLGYGLFGYPQMTDARSGRALMLQVERLMPADAELGLVAVPEQFLLQAQRPARAFGFKASRERQLAEALPWLLSDSAHRLMLPREVLVRCIDADAVIDLGTSNRRAMVLVPPAAVSAACAASEFSTSAP